MFARLKLTGVFSTSSAVCPIRCLGLLLLSVGTLVLLQVSPADPLLPCSFLVLGTSDPVLGWLVRGVIEEVWSWSLSVSCSLCSHPVL